MPAATGGHKPTDIIGSALVEGWWPEDTAITSAKAFEQAFLSQIGVQQVRADEVEQARRTIRNALQSEHDDAMHQKLAEISRQQDQIPEYAREIAETTRLMINHCEGAQRALLGIVEEYRTAIENLCRQGNYLYAAVQFWTARAEVAAEIVEAQSYIEAWGDALAKKLPDPPPVGWTPGTTAPASNGSHDAGSAGRVEAVNNTTIKQDGGMASEGHGRMGATSDPDGATPNDSRSDSSNNENQDKPGRRSTDSVDDPDSPESKNSGHSPGSAPGESHGTVSTSQRDQTHASGGTPLTTPALGGSTAGGSTSAGTTSPAAGLTGLGRTPMDTAGLNSAVKPPVSSLPSTAPAGGGAGAGSGGGSGSGSGRLGGGGVPSVPAGPVTSVAPQAPALSSSAQPSMTPTPGFGSSSPVAQSAPHPSGPVGGPMGGMPAGGAMAAPVTPPPASPVGPAPTQSPGLAQGSVPASPAAAAANAGLGGSAISAGAAPFTSEAPERIDLYAQMAIDAVKLLAPAIAPVPGLMLAAAVVGSQRSQQIVVMTNDGAGWLPEGFFLPPNMLHAVVDLDFDAEYCEKWFGWADPARALIDYVDTRNQQSSQRPVNLLGLASMGPVGSETRDRFSRVVPSVSADRDAVPLAFDRGRNWHRFKVWDASFYDLLRRASEYERRNAKENALLLVMDTPAVQPIRDLWELVLRNGLGHEVRTDLQERYAHARMMCGAFRPGFTQGSKPGTAYGTTYETRFREVRAMEALLIWDRHDGLAEDMVYTAVEAGVSPSNKRMKIPQLLEPPA